MNKKMFNIRSIVVFDKKVWHTTNLNFHSIISLYRKDFVLYKSDFLYKLEPMLLL